MVYTHPTAPPDSGGSDSGGSYGTDTLHSDMYGRVYFPVVEGTLPGSSHLGNPRDGGARSHMGLDISGPLDSPIVASVGGTVTHVSHGGGLGGVTVRIRDEYGNSHYYAHLSTKSIGQVQEGDFVSAGQLIGYVGMTGNAQGTHPHLHYSINGGEPDMVDPWEFLQTGDISRADSEDLVAHDSTNSTNSGSNETLSAPNVPTGGSWMRDVNGDLYVAYRFYGNDQEEGPSEVVYYRHDGEPPAGVDIDTSSTFEKYAAGWHDGGTTDAFLNAPKGKSYQELVNDRLMDWGLAGSEALNDKGVLAIVAIGMTRELSRTELQNRLRKTDYYQSRTDKEREWDDLSEAEKDQRISNAAMRISDLYFTYVGQDLNIDQMDANGDGVVTANELKEADPDVFQWAQRLAKGEVTESGVTNQYLKPLAEEVGDDTPWMRRKREEEQAQGEFDVSVQQAAGEVRDLYYQWGLTVSDQRAEELGNQLAMNEISLEEIEEELRTQAQGMYPDKPEGMPTRQWAQPYMEEYMRTLETPRVDLVEDEMLQRALSEGLSLADFRSELRQDDRWLETDNARREMHDKISSLGRNLGF